MATVLLCRGLSWQRISRNGVNFDRLAKMLTYTWTHLSFSSSIFKGAYLWTPKEYTYQPPSYHF
jgi:hypothetical protein